MAPFNHLDRYRLYPRRLRQHYRPLPDKDFFTTMPSLVIPDNLDLGQRLAVPSRPAEDDEHYVMWRYAGHATRCCICEQPLETLRRGENLCRRGILHARTIKQYIYSQNGKLYSVVDRDMGRRVQIQVPPGCKIIRELMVAVERGLEVGSPKPAHVDLPVRDKNTQMQKYSNKQQRSYDDYDQLSTPIHPAKKRPSEECHYNPRGTLYDADMSEKRANHEQLRKPQRRITWAL